MQHAGIAAQPSLRLKLSACVNLMRPRVTVLLLGTTLAAMAVASNGRLSPGVTLATMLAGALAAGSANAINCLWDHDIDEIMSRTRTRSLSAGRLSATQA